MDLIEKYPPLESFKLSYILEGLSAEYQILSAQNKKVALKKQKEVKEI
jgi:hypothetical protein